MKRHISRILLYLLLTLLLVALAEGVVGIIRVVLTTASTQSIAEHHYARQDPELGWVSQPGFSDDDFFGPGRPLSFNNQGFRNASPIAGRTPPGRVRVLCSGDSFTLGYGVGDRDSWCARLQTIEPRLETVNAGQGGYGLDQSFLLARRIHDKIDVDVHVLALICDDFERMRVTSLYGYGKPVLDIQDGRLVARNQPVPASMFFAPFRARLLHALKTTDIAALTEQFTKKGPDSGPIQVGKVLEVTREMMTELGATMKANGGLFVIVKLPVRGESEDSCPYWHQLKGMANERGWLAIDLKNAGWPGAGMDLGLYLRRGEVRFNGASGHFNESGNELVARTILTELMEIPEFTTMLDDAAASSGDRHGTVQP